MRGLLVLMSVMGICGTEVTQAQPEREFRGAWIATVANLDWPSSALLSPEAQRAELAILLDGLERVGINAVLFQVRPEADAFYASSIEPWSRWLTGRQGAPPEPFYDPLAFVIKEAHCRGIELHAWFNPFRAVQRVGSYPLDKQHVALRHPEWILNFNRIGLKLLDPGRPDVRDYVTSVVMDVVRRYDIDGVHFDDYLYPYPDKRRRFGGITREDDATFAQHAGRFADQSAWRRDNVNRFVEQVHDSIKAVKPWVKFGVSPFGIWQDGVPQGVAGLSAYERIFTDATVWLENESVDYLAPQLYWAFGSQRDYGRLAAWWASRTNGRHLYPGHAAYRAGTPINSRSSYSSGEVPRQIRHNRRDQRIQGSILFRAEHLLKGTGGLSDSLRASLYRRPALTPTMPWLDQRPPAPPRNVTCSWERGDLRVRWTSGSQEKGAPEARRYAIYRVPTMPPLNRLEQAGRYLIRVTGATSIIDRAGRDAAYGYAVTAVSANAVESKAAACVVPGAHIRSVPSRRTARPVRFF